MGDEAMVGRFWCYMCSQMVNPQTEQPEIKCPNCQSGFLEDMTTTRDPTNNNPNEIDLGTDRGISLWAPILLGLLGGLSSSRGLIAAAAATTTTTTQESNNNNASQDGETEVFDSLIRRRGRRSSINIIRMLQDIRSGIVSESGSSGSSGSSEMDRERNGSFIFVNPSNEEAIIVQGSFGSNHGQQLSRNSATSFGDYLIGSGLDLLLQHLLENDPNRHGTLPAKKEAVKIMPMVTVTDNNIQCSICLEDFEIGSEAKEMPCKHKFHSGCILPWLDLHSSCPVCRFQIPFDDVKIGTSEGVNNEVRVESRGGDSVGGGGGEEEGRRDEISIPIALPTEGWFSLSSSNNGGSSTSDTIPGNSSYMDGT